MTLTQEQIKKLSRNLSKIDLDEPKLANDINEILKYIDLLNEVDTTWVRPTVSVIETKSILREDKEVEKEISPKDLLNCSNQKIVANQIAVANIMK